MLTEKRHLKILFLINDFGKGGAERYLIDLCNELLKTEHIQFRIGTLFNNNQYSEFTKNLPITHLNYQPHSITKTNRCPIYKELLDEFEPDIIHTHLFLAEFLSSYYLSNKVKYICHGHDNMVQFQNFSLSIFYNKNRALNYFEKCYLWIKKYKQADCFFIPNSKDTRAYYKKVLPAILNNNIKLIEYGFQHDAFYDPKLKDLPIGNNPLQLINVGSFQNKKNQMFLVEIAQSLRDKKVNFQIHMLGSGENFNAVKKTVAEHELEEQIFFHGNVDNVQEYLKKAHFYVHTATYEPFGLVFLEAMTAGLPCISLDGIGNRELFKSEKVGTIIKHQDPDLFADNIISLSKDVNAYQEMSEYCKSFSRGYDIGNKTKELLDFYYFIMN